MILNQGRLSIILLFFHFAVLSQEQIRIEEELQETKRRNSKFTSLKDTSALNSVSYLNSSKGSGSLSVNVAPCINETFEGMNVGQLVAVPGWTLQKAAPTLTNYMGCPNTTVQPSWLPFGSEFFVRQTPYTSIGPLGTIGHSPLGGTRIAQLNEQDQVSSIQRISSNFSVTSANAYYQYAYCGYFDGIHGCCMEAYGKIEFFDCSGALIPCGSILLKPFNTSCSGSGSPELPFLSGTYSYTYWKVKGVDLSPYIGSCVTVDVTAADCIAGGHYGVLFFDANCSAMPTNSLNAVSFCAGSTSASIVGPLGYNNYQWIGPPQLPPISPANASLQTLSIQNPSANTIYTLLASSGQSCTQQFYFGVQNTSVSVIGFTSNPTCAGGAAGSLTVNVIGSSSGYNFVWQNSTSSVVSTGSVASNLAAGVYSLLVTANNNTACGYATLVSSVTTVPQLVTNTTIPFCSSPYTFNQFSGTNYRWYNSALQLISTASVLTHTLANTVSYILGYTNTGGCRDSVIINAYYYAPPTLQILNGSTILCPQTPSATRTIAVTPSPYASSLNTTLTIANGTNSPLTLSYSSYTLLVLNSLPAGANYTFNLNDGVCPTISVMTIPYIQAFDFTILASDSVVCNGACVSLSVTQNQLPQPINFYSVNWLSGPVISQTANGTATACVNTSPGTQTLVTYIAQVVPNTAYCPVTKTLTILHTTPAANATFAAIPVICSSQSQYSINVLPINGTFVTSGPNNWLTPTGLVTPSLATVGNNTVVYITSSTPCPIYSNTIITIEAPQLTISATPANSACVGTTLSLSASGAQTFTWNGTVVGPTFSTTIFASTIISVAATTSNNCSATSTKSLQAVIGPSLAVTGPTFVCKDALYTYFTSGATTYTWSNGINGSIAQYSVTNTTSITVTANGNYPCKASGNYMVYIDSTKATISGPSEICIGENAILKAVGGTPIFWNTGGVGDSIIVTPQSTSTYSVLTFSPLSCHVKSNFIVTVNECTSINESEFEASVFIRPNPFSGSLEVQSNLEISLTIFDALGKQVFNANGSFFRVNTENFAAGIYFVLFSSGNTVTTKKIIKHGN